MKFSVAFLLVLSWISAINTSPVRQTHSLQDDLDDFIGLLPLETLLPLVNEYVANDKEIQHVIDYIKTEDFHNLVENLESNKDVRELLKYLQESGIDVYEVVNTINEFIGLPPFTPARLFAITGGMAGLVGDIESLLPVDKIKAMYYDKLEHSADFKKLIDRLHAPELQKLVDELSANEEAQHIIATLKEAGVDVNAIADLITKILGIKFPGNKLYRKSARSLKDDFEDFEALLPIDRIEPIVKEYMEKDEEVKHIIEYVTSGKFRDLVVAVESIDDVLNFYNYIQESGLDIYGYVDELHQAMGLPPLNPPRMALRMTGGVAGLIADVKAVLPLEKFKALYEEKLKTSEEFKNLVDRFKSPKFQAIVDNVGQNEEFLHIIETARQYGVNVDAVAEFISSLLGVKFPEHRAYKNARGLEDDLYSLHRSARSLKDDFEDFAALLPVDRIQPILKEYIEKDEEVKHIIEYVESGKFKDLVMAVESIDDVLNFYNYIQESGLDIYGYVNELHQAMGLPPLNPPRMALRMTGGVAGLIADVKAVLPLEKFKALYEEKLKTSEEFKNLVDRFKSPKFQAIVDNVGQNEEFLHIIETARQYGVNVDAVAEFISSLLGVKFPEHRAYKNARGLEDDLYSLHRSARSLKDDFEDFAALLPVDRIQPILKEYIEKDEEVKHIIEYVESGKFKDLVMAVESIDDVLNFYNYIQESGLDIYGYVNELHQAMGLPPLNPPRMALRMTGGVAGLIADVKAVLPLEKFKALYEEKLKTSEEFKNLVDRFKSPKFQAIVDNVGQNEEFLHIIETARQYGVNVDAVAEFISSLLGVKFPEHQAYKNARALEDDLNDFLALVPQNKVAYIFLEYLTKDKEVQAAFEYIQGPEFRQLVKVVEQIDDGINFYNYIQESGLDIYGAVNQLHDIVGLPHLNPKRSLVRISGGINGLIQDIKHILPIDKIKVLYHEKLESSPEFKKLLERLHSPKFQAVVDTLLANPEFQEILRAAKNAGVDVEAVADLLATIFGLKFPPPNPRTVSNLEGDLQDFLFLLPFDKIAEISVTFLANDAEVQEAARYIESPEFGNLLTKLQQEKDISDFLQYIKASGMDLYPILDFLNDVLGIPHLPQPLLRSFVLRTEETSGVQGMLNAIREVLPYDEIQALYDEKLESSEEFKGFIESFKQPEFQALVDKLVVNEAFVELGHQAYLHGIEIKHITDFLQELLGLKFPESSFPPKNPLIREATTLSDDLTEFLDILPVDKIVETTLTYAMSDKETQEAIKYMRSEEFRNIVRELDRIPEYNEILRDLDSAGLDVYNWIQIIHKFIGFDDHLPRSMLAAVGKPGISGLIEELKKLLPQEQIKELYYEKLEDSKAFADFVSLIKSDNFQTVANNLFANDDFKKLLQEAQSHGVDLQAVADFFLRVFGITTPSGVIDPEM